MRRLFSIFIYCVLTFPTVVGAVSEEFTFRAIVGDDTTPPSTPVLEAVTPITTTQIDVDWSESIDNWIFGGYVLLRDGIPIATTTLTNYNDTGLTPETVYSYEVYAFDAAGNLSTTSNSLSTSTLAIVVPPPPATSTPGTVTGTQTIRLLSFTVTPSTRDAVFEWETVAPARVILRWGRTTSYDAGYIESDVYTKSRTTTLTDLEPGTRYLYELVGFTPGGNGISLRTGEFTTMAPLPERVMPNVDDLRLSVDDRDVTISYALPMGEPGARVRIVRSHLGWPTDLLDGAVVYEGNAESFVDRDALRSHETQYYTIFAIGADGTVSSGAVGTARRASGGGEPLVPGLPAIPATPGTTTPHTEAALPPIALASLSPEMIKVLQGERRSDFAQASVTLDHRQPFTLRIDRTMLPPHLKTIIVSLIDPSDHRQQYAFLLRLNKAGDAYEATLAPVGVAGASRLRVEIYDLTQLVVGRYAVPLTFAPVAVVETPVIFPDALLPLLITLRPLLIGLFIVLGAWWLWLWWSARRRAEDNR